VADQTIGPSGPSRSTVGGSRFPPIAEYGFISDCEVCALVAPSGNVESMYLPRMDGPSIFAAILDRHAGWFRLGPADATFPADRRYLHGTMVLETTWDTPTGWAVVRDVLLVAPWRDARRGSSRLAEHQPITRRSVQIIYGIGAEGELTEEVLDHLSGHGGARPVRIGNDAWDQRQHDVWGVLLDSVNLYMRSGHQLDERRWPVHVRQVDTALARRRERDQGLGEVRGAPQHFTVCRRDRPHHASDSY
jgi:GH15 family glucan-1,4-alpha-glucosidase